MKHQRLKAELMQVVVDNAVADYLDTSAKALALCQTALRCAYNVPHLPASRSGAIHTALDLSRSLEKAIRACGDSGEPVQHGVD